MTISSERTQKYQISRHTKEVHTREKPRIHEIRPFDSCYKLMENKKTSSMD